jgi:hypothetical protein
MTKYDELSIYMTVLTEQVIQGTTTASPPPYTSHLLSEDHTKDEKLLTPSKSSREPEELTYTPMKTPATTGATTAAAASPMTDPVPESVDKKVIEKSTPSADSEIRQRKPVAVAAAAVSQVKDTAKQASLQLQHAQPEGVPVNVVFILCLISFLIGYLFF